MNSTNNRNIQRVIWIFAAFVASAVMLTLAQAPISIWPLAWVGYVPFILVCSPKSFTAENAEKNNKSKTTPDPFFIAYVVGAFFWLGNIYWMSFVTVGGWIAFCMYTALLWPILALSLRWCRAKRIPLVVAVPILVVGIEQSQGLLLGGFYWSHLAHSQYANTALIQIADIFGAAGVSFLVAMVNGAIAQIINSILDARYSILEKTGGLKPTLRTAIIWGLPVCAAVIGATIYGKWRINQSGRYITAGPMIAAVQTNVPQSVKQSFAAEEQILDGLLDQNKQCVAAGAKLTVWPETMVQAILEPQVLRLLDDSHTYKQFDKVISEQAREGAYILVGGYGGSPRIEDNFDIRLAQKYNAAFLYTPDGNQSPRKYYKIHLVPFGEVLPFENIPFVHDLLIKFSPYDFDYTIDPGTEFTIFEMRTPDTNGTYRFSTMICYEDAVADIARRFVLDKEGNKQIDWLVNISNDGWFVRFKNDKVLSSTEMAQHTAICAFRAVENRTAILRSVNTGISCMIDTLGQIKDGYKAGNLPQKAMDRQGVAGWFADEVPIDARTTIFSKYGQWLDFSCQLSLGGIIIAQLAELFLFKRKIKNEDGRKK